MKTQTIVTFLLILAGPCSAVEKDDGERSTMRVELLTALHSERPFKIPEARPIPAFKVLSPQKFGGGHPIDPIKFHIGATVSSILGNGVLVPSPMEDVLASVEMYAAAAKAAQAEPVLWLTLTDAASDQVLRKIMTTAGARGFRTIVVDATALKSPDSGKDTGSGKPR